jgi:hypothetical protein
MKNLVFILSIFLLILNSCQFPLNSEEEENFLKYLTVGQKIKYTLLIGHDYLTDLNYAFTYMHDTLELKVLEKDKNKVLISEQITAGSFMKINNSEYYPHKDEVYQNYWIIRDDSLILTSPDHFPHSHLLYCHKLPLDDFDTKAVQIIGWKTTVPYSEVAIRDRKYYVMNYTLLDHFYDRLNIYVINKPMAADGEGTTTIYSKIYGIVRTSVYSGWVSWGYGWDRL